MRYQIFDASKIVLLTFVFSVVIMQLMKRIAVHVDAIDRPRSEKEIDIFIKKLLLN